MDSDKIKSLENDIINLKSTNQWLARQIIDGDKTDLDFLKQLIKDLYKETHSKKECPVCYENIESETIAISNCGHLLCISCYNQILVNLRICPCCRKLI